MVGTTNSKTSLHEFRSGLNRSSQVILLPFEEAIKRPGYISVFAFGPEAQKQILEQGATYGLRSVPLSTEMIYLDIDDNDAAADAAEAKLQTLGLIYERFFSGSRGYHFHLPCHPVERIDLAYQVKAWAKHIFPDCDDSIYKTSGIIRTPGTYHHKKAGSVKRLVSSGGTKLLDLLAADIVTPVPRYVSLDTDVDAAKALDRLWMEPAYSGGRNQEIYRRAFLCRMAGISLETAEETLKQFNELMVHPSLPEREVITATRSAYRE